MNRQESFEVLSHADAYDHAHVQVALDEYLVGAEDKREHCFHVGNADRPEDLARIRSALHQLDNASFAEMDPINQNLHVFSECELAQLVKLVESAGYPVLEVLR